MENEDAVYQAYMQGFVISITGSQVGFNPGLSSLPMTLKQHVAMGLGAMHAKTQYGPTIYKKVEVMQQVEAMLQPAASLESSGPGAGSEAPLPSSVT